MKRKFLIILAFCLLLTGCGGSGKESTILKNREAFDDSGALWYIPNEQIEAQKYPSFDSFAGDLLSTSSKYISDEKSELTLTLLSGTTGEVLQSSTIDTSGGVETQIFDDNIAVCDNTAGTVVVLDKKLHEVSRYTLTPDENQWFLGADLDTLYKFNYDTGITTVSLSSKKEASFLEMSELSICGVTGENISFTGIDHKTLRYSAQCLDLASGKVVNPPFSGDFSRVCRNGDMWLADFFGSDGTVVFGTDSNPLTVTTQSGTFSLLDPAGRILLTDNEGNLSLYDSTGALISSCDLSGWYAQNLIWREELDGYLLLVSNDEDETKLLFWDISKGTSGENLKTQSLSELNAIPGGTSADASLYKRAQSLSERFGVEILIADQCQTEFPSFTAYQVSDYKEASAGLDILKNALSVFPENFLSQIAYGHIDRIQFQLVGGLSAAKDFGGERSYAAFTDTSGTVCRIVLDVYSINNNSVWHELSHAIDKRLAWDAIYRSDALFSEEGWMSRNPSGFTYSETYASERDDIKSSWYSYFIDDYAMISATEDRARIFENAIDNAGTVFADAGLKEKLQYYSDCIRDSFDTTGWEKTTAWEAPLR